MRCSFVDVHVQIAMFKYIRDTDMFETLYSRCLGLRYISDAIANEDAEMTMISKLQVFILF